MTVCKELIVTQLGRRGSGLNENSPLRVITQVYEKSGELVAEHDPQGGYSLEDMLSFAEFVSKQKGSITDWLRAAER